MRHRYRVDLYDDVPLESEISDFLEEMPSARRQEFLRTMLKLGFIQTYGSDAAKLASVPRGMMNATKVTQRKLVENNKPKNNQVMNNQTRDVETRIEPKTENDEYSNNLRNEEKIISNKQEINIPSIIKKDEGTTRKATLSDEVESLSLEDYEKDDDSDGSDDDIVDSLDEFRDLFSGLSQI